jgi:hypothetical protein
MVPPAVGHSFKIQAYGGGVEFHIQIIRRAMMQMDSPAFGSLQVVRVS